VGIHAGAADDDRISVQLEPLEGSPLKRATAVGFIPAPPDVVFRYILGYERYGEFMPHMAESSVLERKENSMRVRQKLNLPWPLADRWYVADVAIDPESRTVGWVTEEGNLETCTGSWSVDPSNGGSRVTYSVLLDPGGFYPSWVVNSLQRRSLPQVIRALREFIEKEEAGKKQKPEVGKQESVEKTEIR
jgi:ribosome-associated toxin RatA of RatAB toxin-antitoxin module